MRKTVLISLSFIIILCSGVFAVAPREAFNEFVVAVSAGDGEKSWALLSRGSQLVFQQLYEMISGLAGSDENAMNEMEKMGITDAKSLWIATLKEGGKEEGFDTIFKDTKVIKEEVKGDTAILTIVSKNKEEKIDMVKENGIWKIDISKTMGDVEK